MPKDFDVNQQVQADVDKFKRLSRAEGGDLSPGAAIEYTLWALVVLVVIGMMVAIPWVGTDKAIPGEVWLGYSLAPILVFSAIAMGVRWLRETGAEIDAGADRAFDTRRGR